MLKPLQVFFFPPMPSPLPLHPLLFSHGHSVAGADSQAHPVSSPWRSLQSLKCFPVFHINPKAETQVFFLSSPRLVQASSLSSFLSENIKKILTPDLIRSRLAFLFLRIVNKITLLKKNPGWNVNAALI